MTTSATRPAPAHGDGHEHDEDPLIKALPPATDYLTYLTILEYQLTPARLPILHKLLQDEKLTTNIGWDLVQLLLPLVPMSQECLQDVARLGNPREVILRVSSALMKLDAAEGDEDEDQDQEEEEKLAQGVGRVELDEREAAGKSTAPPPKRVPLHILQFNCLVSMLSVLHSRIQTKYPSRFVATSLQAVLEAYTSFPTVETTAALLEFFRDIAGKKRPRLPPRNMSETFVTQTTADSAPDPEAESHLGAAASEEGALIQKLIQFGLVELLKTYLLHCIDETPAGMQWALRLQEKLDTKSQVPAQLSFIQDFSTVEYLKERDMTVGKIIALSRDFGLKTKDLVDNISKPNDEQAPPLDFEDIPKHAKNIPIERHGCLLLLAARSAADKLLSSGQPVEPIPVFPDLAAIFSNFMGDSDSPYSTIVDEPGALIDSLLSLAVISSNEHISPLQSELEFDQLVLQLTACIRAPGFRSFSRMARVPATIFHSNPDPAVRFNLIRKIFEHEDLQYAREPAIGWLKEELLSSTTTTTKETENTFTDPRHFAILFPHIYQPIPENWQSLQTSETDHLLTTWMTFTQQLLPFYLSILNLYYLLTQSPSLFTQLQVQKLHPYFRSKFLGPLKTFAQGISNDAEVTARIEMEVGEEAGMMGRGAAELVLHVVGEIEERLVEDGEGEEGV
ncbi:hypothetical protein FQN53_002438 [Emmonsiellopsis sp. PD_33]|nr:hypothetical protein FQN53_002438 [Emmonsiellopsis sp. PD_33]